MAHCLGASEMLAKKLLSACGGESKLYVDDCFACYTYTGNGATQTINNGIDLAGKGGMLWLQSRPAASGGQIIDTVRGNTRVVLPFSAVAEYTSAAGTGVTSLNASGFSVGSNGGLNVNTYLATYVSWTFAKAPKFFDVVTFVAGTNVNRRISHSLGIVPGMVILKSTKYSQSWIVYHSSLGTSKYAILNSEAVPNNVSNVFGSSAPTSSDFGVNESAVCVNGETYVAYIFAHDTSADGIIKCGSYTGNGSGIGPIVTLGWEPQYLMIRNTSGTGNWQIIDSMRGMPVGSADANLQANQANAESSVDYVSPTATGFQVTSTSSEVNTSGSTYIYMAIRCPNKPPTNGAQIYNAIARTGNGTAETVTGVGFAPDLVISKARAAAADPVFYDRLRGASKTLYPNGTVPNQVQPGVVGFDVMDGFRVGGFVSVNPPSGPIIHHLFKRAPGVFDIVAFTGTGTYSKSHNLGVPPEITITKSSGALSAWWVGFPSLAKVAYLNTTAAWGDSANPATASTFSPYLDASGEAIVSYLFSSKAGISKVGSYTGNGGTQTINCGFSTGARFVLIKRTDSTGNWYIWDTARGIVAGNDPHLSLNSTALEVTTNDSIDPDNTGFIVNQLAATNINVTSATYIYLALA